MRHLIMTILASISLNGVVCAEDNAGINLNSLSEIQYKEFSKTIYGEYKNDPQVACAKAEKILIGMLGLEKKQWTHKIFEVNVEFTINSMLLLVADGNKIKRKSGFIDEYKKQSQETAKMIQDESVVRFLETTSKLLIQENERLP